MIYGVDGIWYMVYGRLQKSGASLQEVPEGWNMDLG